MRVSVPEETDERRVLTQMLFTMALGSPGLCLGPMKRPGDEDSGWGVLLHHHTGCYLHPR